MHSRLSRSCLPSLAGVTSVALAFAALAQTGCHGSTSSPSLPSFADITAAPAAIQTAAEAVVRIRTADGEATGSFLSATGLLITNNHVLGTEVCPIEGCYFQITFDYQRGKPVAQPTPVFGVPLQVSVGLDMAVVQVYQSAGGAQLSTPSYLTMVSRDPGSLQKTRVNVVGHPEGDLKKWTAGEVVDSAGDWIWTSAYLLPGNSGSPILNDAGQMVGIVHRGPTGEGFFTSNGALTYSIGTASASLMAAMKDPLPSEMLSVAAPASAAAVVASDLVYLNAHVTTAIDPTTSTSFDILEALGTACDAALAVNDYPTPEALAAALQPCSDGMGWIECRADVVSAGSGKACPSGTDVDLWTARFTGMNDAYVALNGQTLLNPVSFGLASLSGSAADGVNAGANGIMQALNGTSQQLDLGVAVYLAAFAVPSYKGVNITSYIQGYASIPDWQLDAGDLASAATWLFDNGALTRDQALALVGDLYADPSIDDGDKLYIETIEYQSGSIN